MKVKIKKIGQIFLFFLLSLIFLILPREILNEQKISESQSKTIEILPTPTLIPAPLKKSTATLPPLLTASAALALDIQSGAVLFSKNEELALWPASTTKLMTALVALDNYKLDEVLTVKNPQQIGRIMNLVEGEKITVENLLYGLLVHSANDAAYVLAQNHPKGLEGFLSEMNEKAWQLNLENSHFINPAGFDDNKQYTTARDLSRLSLAALKNPQIKKMVGTLNITVSDVDFLYFHPLTNVNSLLGKVPGVAGVKTGWTENAKENLVNLTKKQGREILTVVLGSQDRFGETQILTDWIFANYTWP